MGVAGATLAEETNATFVPHGQESTADDAGIGSQRTNAAGRLARSAPTEMASKDPWGAAINGFQMSVRFSTNVFASGAAIDATVITKNATTNGLTLWGPQSAYVGFIGADSQGKPLLPLPRKVEISGGMALRLAGGEQITNPFRLDKLVDLKAPGTYHIRAIRPIQPLRERIVEPSSGEVTISIVRERTRH